MIKRMEKISKGKSRVLFCVGLVITFSFWTTMLWSQDIFIDSGAHEDTQILVGPHAGIKGYVDDMYIESGPGNDTFIGVYPEENTPSNPDLDTLIITPEIFFKER